MSERFARNSLFSTLAGLATALGSFLSMVVVARLLGPTGTGIIAYAIWLATLAVTLADFGLYQTLTRYLPDLTARGDEASASNLAAYLLRPCLALAALGALAFAWLGYAADGPAPGTTARIWWSIGLLFTLQLVSSFGLGFLRGMQRFDTAAKLTLASLLLQLAAVAAGALLDGVEGALLGYCAGSILPLVVVLRIAAQPARIDRDLLRRTMRFALFSWAGALTMALIWSRLEIFFLQRYQGSEAVALFTVGFTFANLASQGPLLLTGGLLPYFSESYGNRSSERMQSAYATATRVMAFLLFPACLGLAAILPALLPLVYGPAFSSAVPVASVLVAGAAIGATGSVGSQMIYAHERSDFIFACGLVGAALSVAAGFLVVPAYGMMGAALARTCVHAVMVGWGSWFIMRRLGCPMPLVELGKLLAAALLCAAAARLCVDLVSSPAVSLPLAIGSAAIVYGASVRMLGALPAHDVGRLQALTGRLAGRARGPMEGLLGLLAPKGA
jgi:O-antigen/teichoic acid export membrane protein